MTDGELNGLEIAIIGMSGRFPGAKNVEEYWQNLREGRETISTFSSEDLLSAGVDAAKLQDPFYVRRGGVIDDIELFDPAFFGYSPREAAFLDPQQRLFLECAEEALENAGYNARNSHEVIGVYAGVGLNTYFLRNLYPLLDWSDSGDVFQLVTASDKDFLASRVAYKLDLKGPALVIQTACSTSLVAVHLAVQGLVSGECNIALAGGVTIRVPQQAGYSYQEGSILSPDGHCRAFDASAQGTVASNGVGIVVLKRLEDALADRDTIHAVIKGSAINNDGSVKVGYTAPSVQGQVQVIRSAQMLAEVDVESIGYIETHGTGTAIGDPIEIAALTRVFREHTRKEGFCALGSVKTNIGHLDAASGIAGVIKTVHSLKEGVLLPSLHFQAPNQALHLEHSPFYVNTVLQEWPSHGVPRRAGVSSFGIGGTNAHIVMEEAPVPEVRVRSTRERQLLVLSAKTERALKRATLQLAAHLRQHPELELADVAYTLQVGRPLCNHRQALVCHSLEDAAQALEAEDAARLMRGSEEASERPVVFLFPGQGAQYIDMGQDLYRLEPVFRTEFDRCAELLRPLLDIDLREVVYSQAESGREEAARRLMQTWLTQPALFTLEYALAKQWQAWGVQPSAMIGHSLGEFVAACLAGVFTLEDALRLVAARGRLMQRASAGAMLSVTLPEQELQALLTGQLSIAAVNTQTQCVVAGPTAEIDSLIELLRLREIDFQRLRTSHAFHSALMEPLLDEYVAFVRTITLHSPQIPYVSNITGTWITAEQARDPHYWGQQMRQPVRFASGITKILEESEAALLEVGPGRTLSTFARQQNNLWTQQNAHVILSSLRGPKETRRDDEGMLTALGGLWIAGVSIAWDAFHAGELCGRVPLPTYPFERQRYWIDPPRQNAPTQHSQKTSLWEIGQVGQEEAPDEDLYARQGLTVNYVAPRDDLERELAAIWQQLLGVAQVGIYDSFFELGGHSLLATRLVSRLRSDLKVDLPLRAIFEATTVAELGQRIKESAAVRAEEETSAFPLLPIEPTEKRVLSYAQKRLWFMHFMEEDTSFLNIPVGVRLPGPLDSEMLHRSLQEIVNRQETLRTTFIAVDGVPEPVVAPALQVTMEVEDLRTVASDEREQMVLRLAAERVRRPFDLEHGPLLRITLFRLAPEEHVLLLTMHHIISDGWSCSILVRELIELYSAMRNQQPPALKPLAIQYTDFAAWQQQWLAGAELEKQLAYWQQRLGGKLPVLSLPTDHPRPARQTHRGAHSPFQLPTRLGARLRALSQQEGATPFMVLLAAFQIVCSRYSGETDVLIGTPIANRRRTEIENLIGCFVNTLVIRAEVQGNVTFRQFLKFVRENLLEAYANQDLPFEQLVEALQPERDLSRSPIFQVMFMLQNVPLPTTEFADLRLSVLDIDSGSTQFDLSFVLNEVEDSVSGLVEYNVDLFEAETIERMVEHWQMLLQSIVANPDCLLAELPLLSRSEQEQILVEWNRTQSPEPVTGNLVERIERQVSLTPDAVALVYEDQCLTYAQLNARANQLAHYLRQLGAGPDQIIGVALERSLWLSVALLGILKAGAAYMPLDLSYPVERLAFMLANSRVPLVLTVESLRSRVAELEAWLSASAGVLQLDITLLPQQPYQVICLDTAWSEQRTDGEPGRHAIGCQPATNLHISIDGDNLAYVIYTSGSTGVPKGVMNTHRGICNRLEWMQDMYRLESHERVLQKTPTSFDVSVWELFWPLLAGAELVMARPEGHRDPAYLYEVIEEQQISTIHFVPSMLQAFLDGNEAERCTSLRRIICSGEALPLALQERCFQCLNAELYNLYGPTEAAVDVTAWTCLRQSQQTSVPIGRPISNMQIYILDAHMQPVPARVAGDLYIGGIGLARGYHQWPELTAERFVPNPFVAVEDAGGARLYYTGDRARYLPDGTIEYLGRSDSQTKLRGYRIELGEIETRLAQHPAVSECVVIVQKQTDSVAWLVAYVIPRPDAVFDVSELRHYLRERLPEYMVPSHFVRLEAWPLAPNGKLDRKALPLADVAASESALSDVPSTMIEEILAEVWAKILHRQAVGMRENFFDLGGHSLLAIQLLSRVRELFSLELPLRSIFEAPTVAELAGLIERLLQREQAQNVPPLVAVSREQVLPASFAQQRLWFLEQLEMDTAAYHIPAALRMRGALDVPALKRSLGALAERHESLRTSFSASNGEVRQVIHPCTEISLPLVHLCSLVPDAREQELQRLVNSEVLRPFDLTCPPLWRALLFQLDEEEHVLLLTMHHSISDGPSCGIFVDEMLQYYSAFSQGTGCTLAPLSIQYADFSLWQRQLLCGEASGAQLDYWRRQLDGVTLLELPLDHPRPSVQTFRGADITFTLPRHLIETLQAVSRHEGVTLFMTLLAAFQVLLYRYTDQEDITIGTPVTHRNRTELERQIGFYVNTLVLRANLAHNPTFSELLAQIREICLEAYTNQDLPFEQIVEALQPPRDLSRSPFFQVMFMMQHAADIAGVKSVPHLQIDLFPIVNQTAKFDLTLEIIQSSEQTQGRLEYASDLFDAPSMARLVERWQILLEGIAANAEAHIAELPLLTADEYRLSIEEWNATQRPYPADLCLHQLIEAQVEHTPDHIAAVFADEQLSYHELNQRANQLARYLQSITAQPEARVGIYMEPSLLLPVSLLGVLKAGYSYVPIDLAYPDERVGFMMQDAQITILLTQTRHMEKLKGISERIQVVALDAVGSMLEAQGIEALRSSVCPDNLAYILYTSGSTGLPKGVMIPHRGLVNYLHWCSQRYAVVLGQGVPVHSPLSFDLTVTSLFSPLISGQTVLLLPSGQGVEALSSAFQTYTHMSLVKITPAHMALLSQQPEMRDHAANSRLFVIGGEQLLAEKLAFWQELAPETNFINEYGPTETVVGCCIYQVPPGEQTTGPVPIGRPIANTQLYLLSAYGQPVPVGLAGELYIGGAGLAHGYLNRPDLTAERFIPNPFDSRGGTRLYRTGDLARYRADGVLEFLGRNDHQVKVRSFRIELGEIEAVLARFPGIHECAVTVREDIPGVQRLVAYVGTRQADGAASGQQLKMYAQQHLPDYMVPALFVQLEQLPLTSNGKVDRKRLPVPGEIKREDDTEFIAPRTEVEKTLARVWASVLGIDRVGVTDNFFLLGGDSILSMQIIARAAQANLRLTPRQIFQQQTIEALAAVVNTQAPFQAEQGIVEGSVPLTPIQQWFFDQQLKKPDHWNQSVLLRLAEPVDYTMLERAFAALLEHHDALRMRFVREDGRWQQCNAGNSSTAYSFARIDLAGKSSAAQSDTLVETQRRVQASLDLAQGPLLRVVFFDYGHDEPGLLLVSIHHLVIDIVSWQILIDDLQAVYQQLVQGQQPQLPAKTTSYRRWAEQLTQYVRSEEVLQEQTFWLEENCGAVAALPLDFRESAGANTFASARTYNVSLNREETRELQEQVSRVYQTPLSNIVLAMLALTIARWTKSEGVIIDTEGQGREEIAEDVDVSRTVGWFTSIYPVYLRLHSSAKESDAAESIQHFFLRLPHKGFNYSILRYLNPDPEARERFSTLPQAEILFNFVGQIDQIISSAALFQAIVPSSEFDRDPSNTRKHLFEIISGIRDGQLYVDWNYSSNKHHQETVAELATALMRALRTLLHHCRTLDASEAVAQHIAYMPLAREQIERALAELAASSRDVETIDTLSPAQQGMLYETLSAPQSGIHVEQWLCTLTGKLDVDAFRRAWQWEIDRHAIFHTSFAWRGVSEPVQVALRHITLPFTEQDLSQLPPAEQITYLDRYAEMERKQGFDLAQAPLMRLTLFRLNSDTYRLVLTYHHILMDLWCLHLVIKEVFACYQAYAHGENFHLARSLPYTEYIAWLKRQKRSDAERFWRASLAGFTHPTALGRAGEPCGQSEDSETHLSELLKLPASLTADLQRVARQHHLTLNTLFQGTWALLLSRYSGTDDVLFGITVAGRPPELPGVETMVGLCINTLPLRVQVDAHASMGDWLSGIQSYNLDLRQYEYTPAGSIHTWSDVPNGELLYESLLVVENFPESFSAFDPAFGNVVLSQPLLKGAQTRHPLTILVELREALGVGCIYDRRRVSQATVQRILEHFRIVLEQFVYGSDQELNTIRRLIVDEQIPVICPPPQLPGQHVDPPRTPVEYQLTEIWQEVLGVEQMSIHANFLDLGGHSLLATQLVSRIRATFQTEIPLRLLFECPTIAALAERLTRSMGQDVRDGIAQIMPVARDRPLPLSLAQQRLWFLDQLLPGSNLYNIARALRLQGSLNVGVLKRSIEEIVRRHEVLRTHFSVVDEQAIQIIEPFTDVRWDEIDLQCYPEEERAEQALCLARDEALKPLDLTKGPLIRFLVLKLGEEDYLLVVIVHHIVFDVWSESVLMGELVALYKAFAADQPSPLPALPIQYGDFSVWQRQWLQGAIFNEQVAYWQRQLQGASILALPTDHPRQAVQSYNGAMKPFALGPELSAALADLSRQKGVTLFMTLLTAFMTLLSRYTGQTDIVVGTDVANRTRPEIEQLIGFFINLLALRGDLSGNPQFSDLLERVRAMVLDAYAHQELPFEKLVEVLHLEREGNQTPLVRVLFVFQNTPHILFDLENVTATPVVVEQDLVRFDLAFFMWETAEGLMGAVNYSTDLFEEPTITAMTVHFRKLLQNICAQPDASLDSLKIYSEEVEMTKREARLNKLKRAKKASLQGERRDL